MTPEKRSSIGWWTLLAPGILVAATGVGAGDLVTAGIVGAEVGVGIIWVVAIGAGMKWLVNEALARWQLGSGTTVLAGWARLRLQSIFLVYLLIWAFAVAGALINASGVAMSALVPLGDDANFSKRVWGIVHSLVGAGLVAWGGYRLFERVMGVMIGLMFVTVTLCAAALLGDIDWSQVRFVNPLALESGQRTGVFGLIGGVGGTVTLLSYGYWIRERNRAGTAGLSACRLDLAVGYLMTAIFGGAMIIIAAATPEISGQGVRLLTLLGERLDERLGPAARWVFLIGAWGAIFSSLLGVWQSVPYLFADLMRQLLPAKAGDERPLAATRSYWLFLGFMAGPPIMLLWRSVREVQLGYALLGAAFVPLLAGTLLIMTNDRRLPSEYRGRWWSNAALAATLGFFLWQGGLEMLGAWTRYQQG